VWKMEQTELGSHNLTTKKCLGDPNWENARKKLQRHELAGDVHLWKHELRHPKWILRRPRSGKHGGGKAVKFKFDLGHLKLTRKIGELKKRTPFAAEAAHYLVTFAQTQNHSSHPHGIFPHILSHDCHHFPWWSFLSVDRLSAQH